MSVPFNTVFSDGGPAVNSDELNSFIQACNTVSDLRGFIGVDGMQVALLGTSAANDGGQGLFYWSSTSTGPDDNGATAVVPSGAAAGAWLRNNIGVMRSMVSFLAPGTWIVPGGVTRVKARLWGGGGGGGGCAANNGGSSGGGGGYAEGFITVTPGAAMPVVVGAGGLAGGTGGANGGSGGTSTFGSLVATGGGGGAGNNGTPGVGGVGTGGAFGVTGESGGTSSLIAGKYLSSAGGGSFGSSGGGLSYGANGQPAEFPGAAGSGGAGDGSNPFIGGAGAAGLLVIEW